MTVTSPDKLIEEHLASLPEPIKKAIASFDWAREVFDIGRKHNMHIDRIGELQTEVMLVVLGLISPRDFQTELMERIEPNHDIAIEVSDEVNKRVFIRIREFMKKYYEDDGTPKAVAEPPDAIKSAEKKVLNGAGIRLEGDPEPEPAKITMGPASISSEEDGIISLGSYDDSDSAAPTPKIDPIVQKVAQTMEKQEVRPSPITVIKAENAPKGFLDPYREVVE